MKEWITSQNRSRSQRKLNAAIRRVNKVVENDDLWRGRFIIRQDSAQWFAYPGEKDYQLWAVLKFIDKKTGETNMISGLANNFIIWRSSHLFTEMNHFIVDYCDVWRKEGWEGLRADRTNYTKIKI